MTAPAFWRIVPLSAAMTAQQAKAALREMFLKTLPRLDVGAKMREMVRLCDGVLHVAGDRFPLHPGRPVRVVAAGKAALAMTAVLSEIMDGVRLRGVVAAPSLPPEPLPGFDYFQGGHPYPNLQSWESATEALTLLNQKNLRADDLVVFLISGGGSSLMEMPPSNSIRPEDLRAFYELLVTCGAGIREINTVRKHFSRIKGGRLAQAAHPARQITLYVSDVPEDSPAMVASGPTMPDETTAADCEEVLSRYKLLPIMPASYQAEWRASSARSRATPKPGDPCFAQSRYYCLLSNWNGLELLEEMAGAHGINCDIDTRCDDWPVARAADHLLACLEKLRQENPGAPVA